jgi:hypothetical protein
MSEITQHTGDQSSGSITISDSDMPFSAYQAIYHKLTKRVERINRKYDDPVLIYAEDIKNLNDRICQLLAPHNISGSRCEISHATQDGSSWVYSSVEKFIMMNNTAREFSSSLSYEFDFLIVLPSRVDEARDVAQRYKLRLLFEQTVFEKDDARVPFFLRGFTAKSDLTMSLQYTDYAIAQAIEAVVHGWIRSLKKQKKSGILKVLERTEGAIRTFVPAVVQLAPLVSGAAFVSQHKSDASSGISIALFSIGLCYISYVFCMYIIEKFYNLSRKLQPCASVFLTIGDRDRYEDNKNLLKNTANAMSFIAIGVLLSFIINISSSWIYDAVLN